MICFGLMQYKFKRIALQFAINFIITYVWQKPVIHNYLRTGAMRHEGFF